MLASDTPPIPTRRCVGEARALERRPGVLERLLSENAERVLFGAR